MMKKFILQAGILAVIFTFIVGEFFCQHNYADELVETLVVKEQSKTALEDTTKSIEQLLYKETGGIFVIWDKTKITPLHTKADFNGDGNQDIAILASINKSIKFTTTPISKFSVNIAEAPGIPSSEVIKATLNDLVKVFDRLPFIIVFHGAAEADNNDFSIKDRVIIYSGINNGINRMKLFNGRLKTTAAGDERPMPPPKLVGSAILLLDDIDDSGTAIFWHNGRYCWYPVGTP